MLSLPARAGASSPSLPRCICIATPAGGFTTTTRRRISRAAPAAGRFMALSGRFPGDVPARLLIDDSPQPGDERLGRLRARVGPVQSRRAAGLLELSDLHEHLRKLPGLLP